MVDVQVDQRAMREIINAFGSTVNQVELARASALRKMRRRVETAVKRQAAKDLRMPQKAIAGRFFSNAIRKGDDVLTIWIGTQPVSPFSLGSVRPYGVPRKSGGVKAGRRTYRGAFMASVYTGEQKVWIRLHSKHYSPELYPTLKRPGDRGWADLRGRFPLVRAAVPIDTIMTKVVERDGSALLADFERVFISELNYFTNVRGKQ